MELGLRSCLLASALSCVSLSALAQKVPDLPEGAKTRWVVAEPEELVTFFAFDPEAVRHRLPPRLRFITLEELAGGGLAWASDFLAQHPALGHWGVSFLEIVRAGTFSIDGRSPRWPEHGAAALWFARVAPSDPSAELGPGKPFLALEFWVPDRKFAAYMVAKGYCATYGRATLRRSLGGTWLGSLITKDLNVSASCRPTGPIVGGSGSAGMQAFFPPKSAAAADVVRVAFAGHRVQACTEDSTWRLRGTHPLVDCKPLGDSSFQSGYRLQGGTYPP